MVHAVTAIRVDCVNLLRRSSAFGETCIDLTFVELDPQVAKNAPPRGTAVQKHTFQHVQLQV
jgi:hypothetical protein